MARLSDVWSIVREATRHVLRHPVVGIIVAARSTEGRWLLIRRADSGRWAFPGGTLEWGETLQAAAQRELREEASSELVGELALCGVYSNPRRDARFHAVTVLTRGVVRPCVPAVRVNPLEVRDHGYFGATSLPEPLAANTREWLDQVASTRQVVE